MKKLEIISKNKKEIALKEMKSWDNKVIFLLGKSPIFVALDTNSDTEKVKHQIDRSSFEKLDAELSSKFQDRVNKWSEK